MNEIRAIKYFIRLAKLGSFTKVANEINVSKSLISKEISRLESKLGTRLIQRSTRNIQLTEVGHGYLKQVQEIILKLEDAENYVQDIQEHPKGSLKINVSLSIGITVIMHAFIEFMQKFPDIKLDIHLSDEDLDLIENGFDLGIRGSSRVFDSGYIGKVLKRYKYHICASPEYLSFSQEINSPEDLAKHNCFEYSYFKGKNIWPVGNGVRINGNIKANNTLVLLKAVKSGLGIGFLPEFICEQALKEGEVINILEKYKRPSLTVYVLYPARKFIPPKLQKIVEFLQAWFKER